MIASSGDIATLVRENFPLLTDPALIEEIARVGRLMTFREGEIIMDYGAYIKMAPLVIEGTIKVVRENRHGNEIFLYYLAAGDTCASSFSCCLTQKRSFIKTIAEEDTTVIAIPVQYVDEWMTKYRNWKDFVMQAYDRRIMELIDTIDSIAFMKMDQRLMKYLEDRAFVTGSNTIPLTHQEIANDLNASREAVSRLLKKLEQQGVIRLGRNRIELLEN